MVNINAPLGQIFQQVTISSAAVTLLTLPVSPFTAAQVLAAARVTVSVGSNAVRIRYDGTAPTVAIGHKFESSNFFQISGNANLSQFQIIRDGTDDAEVAFTLEG